MGTALIMCIAVLVVPLLLLSTGPASQASGTSSGPSSAHRGHRQPWQLVAYAKHQAKVDVPTTTTTAPPPPTTTTTAPPPPTTTTTAPPPPTTTTTAPPPPASVEEAAATFSRIGVVTYYGTAPGMCASPTLPFGTVVTITNPQNGDTTHCTVDDREADSARQIDLSTETFATIAPLSQGVITDAELSW